MYKIIIVIFLTLPSLSLAQETNLRLASDIWPPFTNTSDQRAIANDIVNKALNRAGFKVSNTITDFSEVLAGIENESYDGSAALWQSEKRKKYLFFSEPYLKNRLILVGTKGSDVSATDLSQLDNKRIAIVADYAYGTLIESNKTLDFITGGSDQENLDRLLSDSVDYMLVDALLIQYLLIYQLDDVLKYLEIGENTILEKNLHFAIRKNFPDSENLMAKFNTQIKEMIKDGTYNRLLKLNWIQADIDGDGRLELILEGEEAGIKTPAASYSVLFQDDPSMKKNNRYYIDGALYDGWNKVPKKFKVNPANGTEDFTFLKFSF